MTNSKVILDQIKLDSQNYPPGILPPGKSMDSLISHTVINISNIDLTQPQVEALQKGLTFYPTPGPPKKSMIWNDFNILADNLDSEKDPYSTIHAKSKPKSTWQPNNTHISLKSFKLAFKNNLLYSNLI